MCSSTSRSRPRQTSSLIRAWEKGFLEFVHAQFPQVPAAIRDTKALGKDAEAELRRAIEQFTARFQ